MKKILFFLLLGTLFMGCAVQTHYIQDSSKPLTETQPDQVKIYTQKDLGIPYYVIGSIAVDVVGNAESAKLALQKEAAKIGANAVVDLKLTKMSSTAARTGLSGVAVFIE